jgi:hypothetical protein
MLGFVHGNCAYPLNVFSRHGDAKLIGNCHSYLRASIGSSSEALQAGYQPKKTPTAAAKANPPITDDSEASVGHWATAESPLEMAIPKSTGRRALVRRFP